MTRQDGSGLIQRSLFHPRRQYGSRSRPCPAEVSNTWKRFSLQFSSLRQTSLKRNGLKVLFYFQIHHGHVNLMFLSASFVRKDPSRCSYQRGSLFQPPCAAYNANMEHKSALQYLTSDPHLLIQELGRRLGKAHLTPSSFAMDSVLHHVSHTATKKAHKGDRGWVPWTDSHVCIVIYSEF